MAAPVGHAGRDGQNLIFALPAVGQAVVEMGGVNPDLALPVLNAGGKKNPPLLGLGVGQFQRVVLDDGQA